MVNYLIMSCSMFMIGILGMCLARKHMMMMLISLELILLSINFNFICGSVFFDDLLGQIYALMVLTVAAAETAMGLALLIIYYRLRGGISIDLMNLLKG